MSYFRKFHNFITLIGLHNKIAQLYTFVVNFELPPPANAMTKWVCSYSFWPTATYEHTLDDAFLVYSHDRNTFLSVLHPMLIFREMTEVFRVFSCGEYSREVTLSNYLPYTAIKRFSSPILNSWQVVLYFKLSFHYYKHVELQNFTNIDAKLLAKFLLSAKSAAFSETERCLEFYTQCPSTTNT